MFNMFNQFSLFDTFTHKSNYNPYISYKWDIVTINNNRYFADSGKSKTNALLCSGQGAKFNGANQYLNTGIVLSFSENFTIIGNIPYANYKSQGAIYSAGCRAHIEVGNNIFQVAIGSQYKGYAIPNGTTNIDYVISYNAISKDVKVVSKALNINNTWTTQTPIENTIPFYIGARNDNGIATGFCQGIYKDFIFTKELLTDLQINYFYTDIENFIYKDESGTLISNIGLDISKIIAWFPLCEIDGNVKNMKTGIRHPITNYTAAVRREAQNLSYGLQNVKIQRDILGVYQYLVNNRMICDGASFADTKWKALKSNFTIEIIQEFSKDGGYHISGKNDSGRIFLGESYESGKAIFRMKDRIYTAMADSDIVYLTMSYNALSDTFNYYVNGVLKGRSDVVGYVDGTLNFFLGNENNSLLFVKKTILLFEVHDKILSQEEVTKKYNKYLTEGLLS